jgi:hypothetical protein
MPTTETPYIARNPRDLITAEDWNQMQILVREDIGAQVQKAIEELFAVPQAGDSLKLEGKTRAELAQEIIDAATQEMNKRTGYMRVFKRLNQEESIIEHGLKDYPVVDVYELLWFDVICSEDDIKEKHKVLFFLYHSSEKRLRTKTEGGTVEEAEIEPTGPGVFKVPLERMLELYGVEYDAETSLGDLETELWEAFFSDPNDMFDDRHYCHSPWFDRCCGEKRSVAELKKRGDWDELWFQTRPVKTVNARFSPDLTGNQQGIDERLPQGVQIRQFDFDKLGAKIIERPTFQLPADADGTRPTPIPDDLSEELPVMILLKV